MEKCIIVAIADNNAIGKNNALLWHLPGDLKYFKQTTLGCPVIMGYMTFKSLGGRPLPGRQNIVISIFPWPDAPEGITLVDSLEAAYAACGDAPKCFVIGGGYTYAEAMQSADTLYITHVHATVDDADVYFPVIDPAVWVLHSSSVMHHEAGYYYEFAVYKRR